MITIKDIRKANKKMIKQHKSKWKSYIEFAHAIRIINQKMISQQLTKELQMIIQEDYGVNLDAKEATQTANNLVECFDLLAKINHENRLKNSNML